MFPFLWSSPEIISPSFYHHDLLQSLSLVLSSPVRSDQALLEIESSGVHVLMVLARNLFSEKGQYWFERLKGPKFIVEHDAYLNFMPESPYFGAWTKFYKEHGFELLICSGKRTTEKLKREGVPAVWVPKGTDARFLEVKNNGTGNLGYFSTPIAEQETGTEFYFYRSRREMGRSLSGIIDPIACPFDKFSKVVSSYAGVITDDRTMEEPMAKQFECSALGCLVIRDRQEELYELGFVEGDSVVSYDCLGELRELVEFYKANGRLLREMGVRARGVALRHTWRDRAEKIKEIVRPHLRAKVFL